MSVRILTSLHPTAESAIAAYGQGPGQGAPGTKPQAANKSEVNNPFSPKFK